MSDIFEFEDKAKVERLIGTLHDPAATTGDVLTVQADKSIAAQPGGGGSGGVQVVTVPVSSAQILALHTTPVVLVPGVAGSAVVVEAASILYRVGLVLYLSGGGHLSVATAQASSPSTYLEWFFVWDGGFLTTTTNQIDGSDSTESFGGVSNEATDWDGQGVVLRESVGNPTLGDGTLLVTLSYFLAPTV